MKKILSIVMAVLLLMNVLTLFAFAENEEDNNAPMLYEIEIRGTADYSKAYDMYDRINNYRSINNFDEFSTDKRLIDAAMQRAAECAVYFSPARPDDIYNENSFETAIPEELANGIREYDTAILSTIDSMFFDMKEKFRNFIESGYKTIGVGIVCHNGIYFCTLLASNVQGEAEQTRTLTKEVKNFSILCDKELLKNIVTEPEILNIESNKTDCVFFEGVNKGWTDVKFIINPQKIENSDDSVISVEKMDNAVKVTTLSEGESNITMTITSVDGSESISGTAKAVVKDPENPIVVLGDVTGDGKVSLVDAKRMLKVLAAGDDMISEVTAVYDVNKDGKLTLVDAKWVLQVVAGIRSADNFEIINK